MRTIGEAFPRYGHGVWYEERGMGFSWGGFHPFRINDWKKAVKKIDQKLWNVTGLDKIKPLANLNRSVWKDAERFDRSVSKDFQKGKKWAQEHRKQLQIAAAVLAAAAGGAWALGAFSSAGTAAGAAASGAAGTASTAASVAGTAGIVDVAGITAPAITASVGGGAATAAAATGGGLLSSIGTGVGIASTAVGILTKLAPKQPEQGGGGDYGPGVSILPPGSYQGGGTVTGGGGGLGPIVPFDQPVETPQPKSIPDWVLPAAGIAAVLLLTR